ncbi:MAG TPA: hypothetical protein VM717_05670 [Chthoniobacterales bacterium]|jgi:hypothetical protein|nr:hypothetical protein [Chthoniobacterales bacterium]
MKRFVPKYLDPASRLGEILFALLFFVGQKWTDYTGSNRLATGSVMVAIGLGLELVWSFCLEDDMTPSFLV